MWHRGGAREGGSGSRWMLVDAITAPDVDTLTIKRPKGAPKKPDCDLIREIPQSGGGLRRTPAGMSRPERSRGRWPKAVRWTTLTRKLPPVGAVIPLSLPRWRCHAPLHVVDSASRAERLRDALRRSREVQKGNIGERATVCTCRSPIHLSRPLLTSPGAKPGRLQTTEFVPALSLRRPPVRCLCTFNCYV